MSKLYPPKIERTLPAFTDNKLAVSFETNPAVNLNDVESCSLIMKNVQTNTTIISGSVGVIDKANKVASFEWITSIKQFEEFCYSNDLSGIGFSYALGGTDDVDQIKIAVEDEEEEGFLGDLSDQLEDEESRWARSGANTLIFYNYNIADFSYLLSAFKKLTRLHNAYIQTYPDAISKAFHKNYLGVEDKIISQLCDKFIIGQHYKVQLAFIDVNGEIGYYSDIGIIKYTTTPEVSLIPKILGSIASVDIEYTQKKLEGKDSTEKAYSFTVDLIDNENNVIESSGEIFYDHFAEVDSGETFVHWQFSTLLEKDKEYKIKCTTTTINDLVITKEESVTQNTDIYKPDIVLIPSINPDDGCVKLGVKSLAGYICIHGYFDIYRASGTNNFKTLELVYSFVEMADTIEMQIFDYSVEQGVKYRYYLQEHDKNRTVYSSMLETEIILANFEDIFISDSKRQLCIKFNPKVSSFKSTILESKMDTLGGQYPFFFRNGNVNYKEFSISGLVSLLIDENELFMEGFGAAASKRTETPSQETGIPDAPTQLTKENFYKERRFKLETLNWLTNGEPKLFRSPAEGNYIVRLMNVSFSPIDTLGRMLHTFNATAYEMAECSVENLKKYKLIKEGLVESDSEEEPGVVFGLLDKDGKVLITKDGMYLIPKEG